MRDLFEWAAERERAKVIDARNRFMAREVAFLRSLLHGYEPKEEGGADPVDLAAYRKARQEAARRAARATAGGLPVKNEEVAS